MTLFETLSALDRSFSTGEGHGDLEAEGVLLNVEIDRDPETGAACYQLFLRWESPCQGEIAVISLVEHEHEAGECRCCVHHDKAGTTWYETDSDFSWSEIGVKEVRESVRKAKREMKKAKLESESELHPQEEFERMKYPEEF